MMTHGCKVLQDLSSNILADETNTIDDTAVIAELQFTEVYDDLVTLTLYPMTFDLTIIY